MNRFLKIAAGIALLAVAFSCCNCRSFQKKTAVRWSEPSGSSCSSAAGA